MAARRRGRAGRRTLLCVGPEANVVARAPAGDAWRVRGLDSADELAAVALVGDVVVGEWDLTDSGERARITQRSKALPLVHWLVLDPRGEQDSHPSVRLNVMPRWCDIVSPAGLATVIERETLDPGGHLFGCGPHHLAIELATAVPLAKEGLAFLFHSRAAGLTLSELAEYLDRTQSQVGHDVKKATGLTCGQIERRRSALRLVLLRAIAERSIAAAARRIGLSPPRGRALIARFGLPVGASIPARCLHARLRKIRERGSGDG